MKCQKGKVCPKQPQGTKIPENAKMCTGCEDPNKDIPFLSPKMVETNIRILSNMKSIIFGGDHNGIDKIIKELRSMPISDELKDKADKTNRKIKFNETSS